MPYSALQNPWFQKWPQTRRNPTAVPPAQKPAKMKSLPQFLREGNYPPKFIQIIPFEVTVLPGQTALVPVIFDDDFPYRLDALTMTVTGPASAEQYASILVDLPSGRRLTRNPVDLYAFNGAQGGQAFVPFRYRFQPSDVMTINVSNSHKTNSVTVRGITYGYKLTQDSRL